MNEWGRTTLGSSTELWHGPPFWVPDGHSRSLSADALQAEAVFLDVPTPKNRPQRTD
jgi:hypothetical protein